MKFKILSILLASLAVSTSASANLISNGDFSAGFSGFSSQYAFTNSDLQPEGTYTVGSNPNAYHPLFVSVSGTDQMLIANGAPGNNQVLLGYTGTVLASGTFDFSASVMNVCCNVPFNGAPSTVLFQIRQGAASFATVASYTTNPPGDAGVSNFVTSSSPFFLQTGLFDFRIIDTVSAASGNDFAIDNLSIEPSTGNVPVPGPIVGAGFPGLLMALGGLVALARRRRNQAV